MKSKNFLIALLLIAVSIALIFFKFSEIPKNLAYDEVEFTKLALSLSGKPYTAYSKLATGHSTLYFYIILFSLKVLGVTTFALRLPAAIFGIFSILIFYLILKIIAQKNKILNTEYSILYTFVFLSSRWFLNFSRFAFEATFLLFLELSSIYFLLLYTHSRSGLKALGKPQVHSWSVLAFSGLFAGLAFNSYTPGRIFFVLPLFFLIRSVIPLIRSSKIKLTKILLYFLVPFIIAVIPLTISFLTNKDTRIDQLFFWRNHEMSLGQKVSGTLQNITTISQMFFIKGDMNGKHNYPGKPALNPILGILFLTGLLVSLKNYKNIYNQIFLLYLIISVFPSFAIYPWENPSMLRTFTALPSVIYFICIAVSDSFVIAKKILNKNANIVYFLVIGAIVLSSAYELRTYFKYQSVVFTQAFEIKLPLEKAVKMKSIYEKSK